MPQISAKYHASDANEYEPGSRNRVLKNLLGLKTKQAVDTEEIKGYEKAYQYVVNNFRVDQRLHVSDIDAIHRHFFETIYPWAGQHRRVNLTKEGFTFPPAQFLENTLQTFEKEVLAPNTPCSGSEEEVLVKIAKVHLELLFIHPYREGNGRTARLVATLMALQAGYEGFDWSLVDKRFDEYVKAIQTLDWALMATLLDAALVR
jgi:cell filamentation protein